MHIPQGPAQLIHNSFHYKITSTNTLVPIGAKHLRKTWQVLNGLNRLLIIFYTESVSKSEK